MALFEPAADPDGVSARCLNESCVDFILELLHQEVFVKVITRLSIISWNLITIV